MGRTPDSGAAESDLSRVLFGLFHELSQGSNFTLRGDDQNIGLGGEERDWSKVIDRVEIDLRLDGLQNHGIDGVNHEGMAVRLGFGHVIARDGGLTRSEISSSA